MFSAGLFNTGLVGTLIAVQPEAPQTVAQRSETLSVHEQDPQLHLVNRSNSRSSGSIRKFVKTIKNSRKSHESDRTDQNTLHELTHATGSLVDGEHSGNIIAFNDTRGVSKDDLQHGVTPTGECSLTVSSTVDARDPSKQCPSSPTTSHSETNTTHEEEKPSETSDRLSPLLDLMASIQHRRGDSFHVNWTAQDVPRLSREVYDETIADVHLSLFAYWIREKVEHYELAKPHIRELALDQGYKVDRVQNLKLRQLLLETFSVRPGVPECADEVNSGGEPVGEARLRATDSQWLRETLQLLDNPRTRGPFPEKATIEETLLQPSPKTPSNNANGDKRRAISSPLIARVEKLPGSLQAQRKRILSDVAMAAALDPSRSSPRLYPPNTPDRPAPLSLKSRSSNSLSGNGTPCTPLSSPLTASALESLSLLEALSKAADEPEDETQEDVDTKFNEVIRRSISSSRATYRFSSASMLQSPAAPTYQIIDKEDGDVFGIDEGESVKSESATEIYYPRGKLSTIFEASSPGTSQPLIQPGFNRLSDADWQTEVSGTGPVEAVDSARQVREEYHQFLVDAHEDPHGKYNIDTNESSEKFPLDPEDESDGEEASPFDTCFDSLSSYVSTNVAESFLETASNASEETVSNSPTVQYSFASRPKSSLMRHGNQSSATVDCYRPLPPRHYEREGQDESSIHPAFRKGYSNTHDLVPPGPTYPQREDSVSYTFFESYLRQNIGGPPSSAPPAPASVSNVDHLSSSATIQPKRSFSEARKSPVDPPPPLPNKSPLRDRKGPGLTKHNSRLPVSTFYLASSHNGPTCKTASPSTTDTSSISSSPNTATESSFTQTLAQFPLPGPTATHSPNGADITHRPSTPFPHSHPTTPTPSKIPIPQTIENAHARISTSHIDTMLSQPPIPVPTIDMAALSPFERTWRIVNKDLLVQTFGSVDVVLSGEDVELIERIVQQGDA